MPPRQKIDQGLLIILDVGKNVSTPDEKGGKSFFEKARDCTIKLIERKITSLGKNLVGVILLGSKTTNNSMAEQCKGLFRHVQMLADLDEPQWRMIRDLPKIPSEKQGDWVDALIVAADHFKNQPNHSIHNQKVILMTNFEKQTATSPKDLKMILDGYLEDNIEVSVIGPNLNDDLLKGDLEIARQFVDTTKGQTAPFDDTMDYLLFHKKKNVSAHPWNVDLSIGPNIKIPVSAFLRTKDETPVKKWGKAVRNPVTSTASTDEAIVKKTEYLNNQDLQTVENPELVKGYHFGQSVIPFSEVDQSMLYQSGEKCLSVYGFTSASNIGWQCLNGDGLSYVFGRKGDRKAQHAFRCLVECLHELNLVGIVRRVFNKNNVPKMFALFPVIDSNDFICLSIAGICYKDDIKYMSFPRKSSKKDNCSEEQVNVFKDLIKAMDLTRAYDDTYDDAEAFPIAQTFSPYAQYVLDCIAYRALNPNKALPPPRNDIIDLFRVPPTIESRSKEPLEKLKSLFVLNKVEKKVKKVAPISADETVAEMATSGTKDEQQTNEIPKIVLPVKPTNDVEHITTVDPVSDFISLRNKEKSLQDLVPEMTSAIEELFYYNLVGVYDKPFEAMLHLRKECVASDPSLYNNWLQNFKAALNDRKKHDIITKISDKNVNFILKAENDSSTYTTEDSHEDSQLYENDTVPASCNLTMQSEVNNFFDEF